MPIPMETTRPSLLLRIRDASDEASWEVFHAIYRPLLIRFARARGVGMDDAEDICQQVLAVVHAEIKDFEYDGRLGGFKAWLQKLVMYRVSSLFRHREVQRKGAAVLEDRASKRDSAFESPDASFEKIWLEEHLWHVMKELDAEVEAQTMQIFRALVFEQKPVERIAQQFSVSEQNIYTIKWRITRRIGERMKQLTGEEGSLFGS